MNNTLLHTSTKEEKQAYISGVSQSICLRMLTFLSSSLMTTDETARRIDQRIDTQRQTPVPSNCVNNLD
jgi:hypothetical protein